MINIKVMDSSPVSVRASGSTKTPVSIPARTGVIRGEDGKSPYISENGTWICWDDEARAWIDTGIRAQGPKGDAGSDADVTAENIAAALGYTPVKPDDVPEPYDDTDIREEIAKRSILAANETVSGKKTFAYGTNSDPAVAIVGAGTTNGAAIQIGTPTNTGYSVLSFYRKCADDGSFANRGDMLINKDGSMKICHRRAKTTSVTSAAENQYTEDATLLIKKGKLAYKTQVGTESTSDTNTPEHDIFYDGYEAKGLTTKAKDLIGAINEVNGKSVDEQTVKNIVDKDYIMSLIDDGSEVEY